MDQPPSPPDKSDESADTLAEQDAAHAVASEESVRRRAWRETARTSTSVIRKQNRRLRLLLPILLIISLVLGLTCVYLFYQMRGLKSQELITPRRQPTSTRAPLPPEPTVTTPIALPVLPIIPDARPSEPTNAPPPAPLIITIPAAAPPTPPQSPTAAAPPLVAPLSAEERRQWLLYEQRLVSGTDLLGRDLAEREQTVMRTQRRLTFEPERQPPLGAIEQLAEAIRYWEGAVGDERERFAAAVHNRRAEIANLQRQLLHDQEVAESLRKRLDIARQELDGVRKKLGPPP